MPHAHHVPLAGTLIQMLTNGPKEALDFRQLDVRFVHVAHVAYDLHVR